MGQKHPVFVFGERVKTCLFSMIWVDVILARRLQYPLASISELQGGLAMKNLIKTIATVLITFLVFVGCGEMAEVEFDNGKFSAAEKLAYSQSAGAGIYIKDSTLTVVDTEFTDNISGGQGGAIYAESSLVQIDCEQTNEHCMISRNSAQQGGAIYFKDSLSDSEVKGIHFQSNTAHLFDAESSDLPMGNAIVVAGSSDLDIEFNKNNYSGNNKAGFIYEWSGADYEDHLEAFAPYQDGEEAHIAVQIDDGTVEIASNTLHACSGWGDACAADVYSQNRFVQCDNSGGTVLLGNLTNDDGDTISENDGHNCG